mmetsp:Transcript_52/g.106  ORF Transcript_52/g.106 Transcript_52/m.106 type:complete len:234 (+) Transcript_52:627-1328(+)
MRIWPLLPLAKLACGMKPSRCSPPKAELKSWPSSGACWRSTGGSGGGGGMDGTGGKASDCWRGMQNALSGPPTGVPPAPEAGAGRLAASMSPICCNQLLAESPLLALNWLLGLYWTSCWCLCSLFEEMPSLSDDRWPVSSCTLGGMPVAGSSSGEPGSNCMSMPISVSGPSESFPRARRFFRPGPGMIRCMLPAGLIVDSRRCKMRGSLSALAKKLMRTCCRCSVAARRSCRD